MYYLQTRYYAPEIGRFINADDTSNLGIDGEFLSFNLFAYCGNEPKLNIDFTGESFCDALKAFGEKTVEAGLVVLGLAGAVSIISAAVAGTVASGGAGAASIPAAVTLATECLVKAGVITVALGTATATIADVGENLNTFKGGPKGKTFRGGSKASRDNWYGHNEQAFHKWFERSGKQTYNDGMDIESKARCDELYEIWKELGCPYPK